MLEIILKHARYRLEKVCEPAGLTALTKANWSQELSNVESNQWNRIGAVGEGCLDFTNTHFEHFEPGVYKTSLLMGIFASQKRNIRRLCMRLEGLRGHLNEFWSVHSQIVCKWIWFLICGYTAEYLCRPRSDHGAELQGVWCPAVGTTEETAGLLKKTKKNMLLLWSLPKSTLTLNNKELYGLMQPRLNCLDEAENFIYQGLIQDNVRKAVCLLTLQYVEAGWCSRTMTLSTKENLQHNEFRQENPPVARAQTKIGCYLKSLVEVVAAK